MLTQTDMRARYIAAALSAINSELQRDRVSADDLFAISERIGKITTAATRLADDLALARPASIASDDLQTGSNVVSFENVRRHRCAR